jgi:formate hydrogenlyase subunit 4
MIAARLANLPALLLMPFLLSGVVNRVKALWSGRKGPPLFQLVFDVLRLLRKQSVYSKVTTPLFWIAPYVLLLTAVLAALITPLLGSTPLLTFRLDFVWLAYVFGLGRVALMLAALDTGSSFEGMGAAREATFSTLVEPTLFLVGGALCLLSGNQTLALALVLPLTSAPAVVVWAAALSALLVVLQVETARMPIDDPTTHLELTMIHEVMVLDHSGPDLAAIQVGSAVKLYVCTSLLATLLSPLGGRDTVAAALLHLGLCVVVAIGVGTIESLVARLKLRALPQYLAFALLAAVVALLATAWRLGGAQ